MGKWWAHRTGLRVDILAGKGHAPNRAVEYACFWAGWCRVTVTEATVYIEGGDLRDIQSALGTAIIGDRKILADVTVNDRKTKKYIYADGAWIRERSRGREPEVIRLCKAGLGRAGWDYPPNTGP